ncbi:CRISPR-associated helicase Cas3' [Brachybacterium hainanense]|uniref:CRISPR-associated helicase Cas3 n=1 Tax=Brachybacterium hainanense TaxID=1541174 RepID=A0ABV6R8Z9_9MICO
MPDRELWGKYDPATRTIHPLVCHLLDVAHVAGELYNHRATNALRESIPCPEFMLAAALHDMGKATPHFTGQLLDGSLVPADLPFDPATHAYRGRSLTHEALGAAILLRDWGVSPSTTLLSRIINVERGGYLDPYAAESATPALVSAGPAWDEAQRSLIARTAELLSADENGLRAWRPSPIVALEAAGLIKIADWVGSYPGQFPLGRTGTDEEYAKTSAGRAATAVRRFALIGDWKPPQHRETFEDVFGFAPRPLQEAVWGLRPTGPTITVLEDATGAGKTAGAWACVLRHAEAGARGVYVAMPTHATSAAIHPSLDAFLRAAGIFDRGAMLTHRNPTLRTAPSAWLLGRHRALASPVGVGTVDTLLRAVLPTPYRMVALAGLAGRVVVFDEVHGYDPRMMLEFETLLAYLAALGCPVVVLSATLRPGQRQKIIAAYRSGLLGATVEPHEARDSYPLLTTADASGVQEIDVPSTMPPRSVQIDRADSTADVDLPDLRTAPGIIGIVCNSVRGAVTAWKSVIAADPGAPVLLLHSRLTARDRAIREKTLLAVAGKDGHETGRRQKGLIIISTQIIEESLDIDLDLLITEPCPADNLIQRLGRLHRHDRAGNRPSWATEPRVVIAEGSQYVYEQSVPHALFATRRDLADATTIEMPEQIVPLVRAAYGDRPDLADDPEYCAAVIAAEKVQEKRIQDKIARSPWSSLSAAWPTTDIVEHIETRQGTRSTMLTVVRDGTSVPSHLPVDRTDWNDGDVAEASVPVPDYMLPRLQVRDAFDADGRPDETRKLIDATSYHPTIGLA